MSKQKQFESGTFRNSFTSREGHIAGRTLQGRVVNINLKNWTVDVHSQFDRHFYLNIQVGSPYVHFNNGEGFGAFPEVGSVCMVTLPSDSSPPFVSSFLMPPENIQDASTADAPAGTRSRGNLPQFPTDTRFGGGRPARKPGDMWMTGRDGNFVILHRGGVVSIGATELAQRIYIPLNNTVLDVSENYQHYNVGGAINWGLQDGAGQEHFPTQFMQSFRVYADDQYADIRVTKGKVYNPMPMENASDLVVYEVVLSPKGFVAESGDSAGSGTTGNIKFQFAFDRAGNVFCSAEGDILLRGKKTLRLSLSGDVDVSSDTHIGLTAKKGMDLDGGVYSHLKGDLVRLGKGDVGVARKGDLVTTKAIIPVKAVIVFATPPIIGTNPVMISFLDSLGGVIVTGNDSVRA